MECLGIWRRDVDGFVKLVDRVLNNYEQDKLGHEGVFIVEEDAKVSSNGKQCLRKIADGHFTTTVKVLGSSGVSPYNAHIMKVLEVNTPPPC